MTLSEFKAWFEGFTEDMDGPPNERQWKRVKERVKEITGVALTERVFVDKFWPRPWRDRPYFSTCLSTASLSASSTHEGPGAWTARDNAAPTFDSHAAMLALGKADYAEV